jgi:2-polyprenyl-3-methyl-5-hydroxy-6-metoxy-1,4-benzoquinol methylase
VRTGTRKASRGGRFIWKRTARLTELAARFADVGARLAARVVARSAVRTVRRVQKLRPALGFATNLLYYYHPDELQACPACRSSQLALLAPLALSGRPRGRRFGFVGGCHTCGLLFSNPMPSAEELRVFYSPDGVWGLERHEEAPRSHSSALPYVLDLLKPAREWIDPLHPAPGGAVFEFGCGDGHLLDAFGSLGWETYGLDPGNKRAFPRHRELHMIPSHEAFDVVVAHHVLEHVATPLEVLQGLNRALKPGGLLVVSVPRVDTLPRHRDFRYCINPRTHIVAYSRDCMATLLAMSGFDSIDGSPPPDTPDDGWFVLRRLRMIGRKSATPAPAPVRPLLAAQRALAAFEAQQPAWDAWHAHLPVRTRAALSDMQRSRR